MWKWIDGALIAALVVGPAVAYLIVALTNGRLQAIDEQLAQEGAEDVACPECGADVADGDWHDQGCVIGMEVAQDWADEAAVSYRQDEGW